MRFGMEDLLDSINSEYLEASVISIRMMKILGSLMQDRMKVFFLDTLIISRASYAT